MGTEVDSSYKRGSSTSVAPNQKIKGGDVLIFRMEILQIKGGKVRAAKCDFKTRENCEPQELEVLDAWGKKPMDDVATEVKALTKKSEEVLKSAEREKVTTTLKVLKQIQKARKKA